MSEHSNGDSLSVPITEGDQIPKDYQLEIRQALLQAEPFFIDKARQYEGSIQFHVVAPQVQVKTEEDYMQVMGQEPPDIGINIFTSDYNVRVRQELGFLNISGIDTDERTVYYHSVTEGKNFTVKIGPDTVTTSGISLQDAAETLKLLLGTAKNNGDERQKTIHLGTIGNPFFFNPDGTRKNTTSDTGK